jgi:hypothetical protein
MGYNARNDEIRDNVTRMRREWEARGVGDGAQIQRSAFRQRLCLVLAEDHCSSHIKTSLAGYQLRQLRDRCGFGFASEATRPGGFYPRCAPRRIVVPALQWLWPSAHHCFGAASVYLTAQIVGRTRSSVFVVIRASYSRR